MREARVTREGIAIKQAHKHNEVTRELRSFKHTRQTDNFASKALYTHYLQQVQLAVLACFGEYRLQQTAHTGIRT